MPYKIETWDQKMKFALQEMTPKEKKRFEDMAEQDKSRYEKEMTNYVPSSSPTGKGKKRTKDPNAPKRAL